MRSDSLQMVELLSLEDKHGRCTMKLGASLDSGETGTLRELEVELDEATYKELGKLDPLSNGRVRLSLYAKYDPFRYTYFSSIVKLQKTRSESYYFQCTADYEAVLERLRRGEVTEMEGIDGTAAPHAARASASAAAADVGLSRDSEAVPETGSLLRMRKHMRPGHYAMVSLRPLLLTCMILLVWFEVEGQIAVDQAKALSEHRVAVVSSGAGEGPRQGEALEAASGSGGAETISAAEGTDSREGVSDQADDGVEENKEVPTDPDNELVELVTLDGDVPLYKLPDGYVALTFDDGPSDYTKAIVDELQKHGVAGTFLFVGRNVNRYSEEAAYAAEHGMAVGNHSWDHGNLTKLPIDVISANIEKANDAIAKRSSAPVSVFRPPYGAMNDELEIAVSELGMKLLMWNRDPQDWKAGTPAEIVRYFKKLPASGGIYVMHEKKATLEALPEIIDYLLEQKLKFAVFQ